MSTFHLGVNALILLLANPKAGYLKNKQSDGTLAQLHQILGNAGHIELTDNLQALEDTLHRYKNNPPTVLVPFGGDGTVSVVIGCAAKVWGESNIPPIFPVHAGTMNMIAWDVYPNTPPLKAIAWLAANHQQLQSHMGARYPIRTSTGQFGFVFGFGVTVNFMHAYYALGSGPWAAMKLIANLAIGIILNRPSVKAMFATVRGQVQHNQGPKQAFSWQACLALSIRCLPLRFRVSNSGGPNAQAHMCVLSGVPNKLALVLNLFNIWRGRMPASVGIDRTSSQHLTFEFEEPTAWQLDGDLHPHTHQLEVRSAPAVRFVEMK